MSDMAWNFSGKTALVTGAAGGIGEAIVRKLAAASADVVFSDLKEADGRALERELCEAGASVRFVLSNATDEAQVKALVATALSINNRLDIAINNVGGIAKAAGDGGKRRIHDTDLTAWHATVDLNLTSCFLGMKHQLPPMMAAGRGAIVNLTSLAGLQWSDAAGPSYSAAKAGVVRLTKYAAVAYASAGIRVNVVAPGFTATRTILQSFPDEAERRKRASTIPMGRMLDPNELANACLWACSDAASGVTGVTIPVDGGKMAM
jgi:NAD(P)-dependent dehydrogenase (short-subunit alcohol dehydrogenase family)